MKPYLHQFEPQLSPLKLAVVSKRNALYFFDNQLTNRLPWGQLDWIGAKIYDLQRDRAAVARVDGGCCEMNEQPASSV